MSELEVGIILGFCVFAISSLTISIIRYFNAKRANYNCKTCKNWDCDKKLCIKRLEKQLSKERNKFNG